MEVSSTLNDELAQEIIDATVARSTAEALKDESEGRLLDIKENMEACKAQLESQLAQLEEELMAEEDVLAELRAAGCRIAVISGGVKMTLELALPEEAFDEIFINEIEYDAAGRISGGRSTPYDGAGKARGLEVLANRWGLTPAQIAFVGDGSNDVEIADMAGFSVAWGDSPQALREASDLVLEGPDLRVLIPHLLNA